MLYTGLDTESSSSDLREAADTGTLHTHHFLLLIILIKKKHSDVSDLGSIRSHDGAQNLHNSLKKKHLFGNCKL